MPDRAWLYEHLIHPEETDLHSAVMTSYIANVISYVLAELQYKVLEKWSGALGLKWAAYDAYAISAFRAQQPSGFGSVEELYNYAQKGVWAGLGVDAAKAKSKIGSTGVNPFLFLARISTEAQGMGPNAIKELNAAELQNFKNVLANADSKIAGLEPGLRLMTAVEWSITKGFAAQGILGSLDNLDKILLEMLEEFAKDKAVKKAIMTGVGFLGPWGRAISTIYNILELFDDVRDTIELALLVKSFIETLDAAKDSKMSSKPKEHQRNWLKRMRRPSNY